MVQELKHVAMDKGTLRREVNSLVGKIIRLLDARGNGPSHAKCDQALNDFLEAWEHWKEP